MNVTYGKMVTHKIVMNDVPDVWDNIEVRVSIMFVNDIGNRTTAEGKTYTANNLNQYTAIDDFTPQYDADGNQTLIQTSTGIWSVQYNAENRPIRWTQGSTSITMSFDRMGRRIEMRTLKDGSDLLQRFVYDNYLCIQQLRTPSNTLYHSYIWDPTEPIATRPLIFLPSSGVLAYYFHDGNKNVSDLVDIQENIVHYAYTPFGTPIVSTSSESLFSFSSECYDNQLGLVYYNYRHLNSQTGRWLVREFLEEYGRIKLFVFGRRESGGGGGRCGGGDVGSSRWWARERTRANLIHNADIGVFHARRSCISFRLAVTHALPSRCFPEKVGRVRGPHRPSCLAPRDSHPHTATRPPRTERA